MLCRRADAERVSAIVRGTTRTGAVHVARSGPGARLLDANGDMGATTDEDT